MSKAHIVRQLFDVAMGLEYMHAMGIVHGDLKGVRDSS
jgi:serine/threonine protein kinase